MNVTVTMQFSSMDEVSDFFRGHSASGVPNFQPAQTMVVEKPLSPAATEAMTPAEAAFGKAISAIATVSDTVVAKRRPGRPPESTSAWRPDAGGE